MIAAGAEKRRAVFRRVPDNLKAAVIKADWYDPAMNPKKAYFCRHYGMTPMPCVSYTPQHKRKVARGAGYSKGYALKGPTFASLIEADRPGGAL